MKTNLSSLLLAFCCVFSSCTISFSNVDTHGTASNLIDEEQNAQPNISPNINIPTSPIAVIGGK